MNDITMSGHIGQQVEAQVRAYVRGEEESERICDYNEPSAVRDPEDPYESDSLGWKLSRAADAADFKEQQFRSGSYRGIPSVLRPDSINPFEADGVLYFTMAHRILHTMYEGLRSRIEGTATHGDLRTAYPTVLWEIARREHLRLNPRWAQVRMSVFVDTIYEAARQNAEVYSALRGNEAIMSFAYYGNSHRFALKLTEREQETEANNAWGKALAIARERLIDDGLMPRPHEEDIPALGGSIDLVSVYGEAAFDGDGHLDGVSII